MSFLFHLNKFCKQPGSQQDSSTFKGIIKYVRLIYAVFRSSHRRCQRKLPVSACNFIKKETLFQVFSCESREISENTFFTEHLWVTASQYSSDVFYVIHKDNRKTLIAAFLVMLFQYLVSNKRSHILKTVLPLLDPGLLKYV